MVVVIRKFFRHGVPSDAATQFGFRTLRKVWISPALIAEPLKNSWSVMMLPASN